MVVPHVLVHQPFQKPLIHHDHMVDQITAAVANPALGDSVLPRTSEAGPFGLNAEAPHCVDHLLIEVCGAVEDQVTGQRIVCRGRFIPAISVRRCLAIGLCHTRAAPVNRSWECASTRQRSCTFQALLVNEGDLLHPPLFFREFLEQFGRRWSVKNHNTVAQYQWRIGVNCHRSETCDTGFLAGRTLLATHLRGGDHAAGVADSSVRNFPK